MSVGSESWLRVARSDTDTHIRTGLEHLQRGMDEEFERLRGPGETWALMLPFPTTPMARCIEEWDDIKVVLARTSIDDSSNVQPQLVSRIWDLVRHEWRDQQLRVDTYRAEALGSLNTRLTLLAQSQNPQRVMYFTAYHRLRTAISISSWAALGLWSSWLEALCSCRVGYMSDTHTSDSPIYSAPAPAPSGGAELEHCCNPTSLGASPYLRLAVLLAGLALGRPVSIIGSGTDKDVAFLVEDHNLPPLRRFTPEARRVLDKARLAFDVGVMDNGPGVDMMPWRRAVEHCMRLDDHRSDEQKTNPAAVFRTCSKSVTAVLCELLLVLQKQRQLYRHDNEYCSF